MIIQHLDGQLLIVRQPDHGIQTAEFARRWGNEDTPPFEPRIPVIEAGARHDNGWATWEQRPTLDPRTERPWQFFDISPHEHIPLYREGIQAAADRDPYTGILVSMHGAGLYNDRYGTFRLAEQHFSPAERLLVDEFLAEQATFQQSLAERLERKKRHSHVTTDPAVFYNYLLLQLWDRLSLQFAFRLASDGEIAPLPHPDGSAATLVCRARGRFSLELEPWPFDEAVGHFPVEARLIPDRAYRTSEEFVAEMARASVMSLECKANAA